MQGCELNEDGESSSQRIIMIIKVESLWGGEEQKKRHEGWICVMHSFVRRWLKCGRFMRK